MDRRGLEQLPIVEPIFDNLEEARAHAETEQQEMVENSLEKDLKSKRQRPGRNKNEFAWRHVTKRLDPLTGKSCVACVLCDKTFNFQRQVDSRRIINHLYRAHQIRDPQDEAHVCSQCGRSFALRSELQDHEFQKHREREPYQCPQCEKAFKTSGGLRIHLRHTHLHPGEKTFQERTWFANIIV